MPLACSATLQDNLGEPPRSLVGSRRDLIELVIGRRGALTNTGLGDDVGCGGRSRHAVAAFGSVSKRCAMSLWCSNWTFSCPARTLADWVKSPGDTTIASVAR